MTRAKVKISWLVPHPIEGSGGHRTIFAHVRDLVARGYECVMYVRECDPANPQANKPAKPLTARELESLIERWFFPTGAKVVASWDVDEPCDILVATMWESAYAVKRAAHGTHRAYFVQDFEAWFSAMGDGYLGAENTYRLGLECVTIGRFLTHLITTEFKGRAGYIDFTSDETIYRPDLAAKTPFPSVAFLYQPEKPRRCPHLGRETLGIVKHHVPEAQIFMYGSDAPADLWFEHERMGLVTPKQCADLYRRAHVGLCISSSNPSRIPFEMMASGCAVVDLARPNNYFDYDAGSISLVDSTAEALAWRIIELLRNDSMRDEQIRRGLTMMQNRHSRVAYDQAEELFARIAKTGLVQVQVAQNVEQTAHASDSAPPVSIATSPPSSFRSLGQRAIRKIVGDTRERMQSKVLQLRGKRGLNARATYAKLEAQIHLHAKNKKVIAFDVFDTLLHRRVEPDTIKELVARRYSELLEAHGILRSGRELYERRRQIERQLCLENQRSGRDEEFNYEQMLNVWVETGGAPQPDRARIKETLALTEDTLEARAQEVHPLIPNLLLRLKRAGFRLIFISDFYLPIEQLHLFLRRAGIDVFFDAGYASSTEYLRKATGRLFERVLEQEGIVASELLMVGDNRDVDVTRANERGIDAIHVVDPVQAKRRMRLSVLRSAVEKNPYWKGALAAEILGNANSRPRKNRDPNYQLGKQVAPAFVSFAEHIAARVRRDPDCAYYFCAREGLIFCQMTRALLRESPRGKAPVHYLGVSRKSTFLPSMNGLSKDELSRFLRQYAKLSPRHLIESLGLPFAEFEPLLRKVGFQNPDTEIENILESEPLSRFIADSEIQKTFSEYQEKARELFVDYLRQKGFFHTKKAVLIDIGWKGSIIDNVVRAMGSYRNAPAVEGLLFGTQEDVSQDICPKTGFFVHGPARNPFASTILANVALFEMHATAPHGSIVGYERKGARVRAVTRYFEEEKDNWQRYMRAGQRAIREYFAAYLQVRPLLETAYERSPDEWLPFLHDRARRILHYPNADEVKAFMQTRHVESFGALAIREFSKESPSFLPGARDNGKLPNVDDFYKAARFTVWPAGMIERMNVGMLKPVYDLYDTWHRANRW